MPTIQLDRPHHLSIDDVTPRLRALVDEFLEEYPAVVKGVEWGPSGHSARAHGRGFEGTFSVDDAAIHVRIELSMLLAPMRGRVEASLERRLDRALGS